MNGGGVVGRFIAGRSNEIVAQAVLGQSQDLIDESGRVQGGEGVSEGLCWVERDGFDSPMLFFIQEIHRLAIVSGGHQERARQNVDVIQLRISKRVDGLSVFYVRNVNVDLGLIHFAG